MSLCQECVRKDRVIKFMHEQSENYRHDAELWKKYLFHVQKIIRDMRDKANDAMWYPSTYEVRGETGCTEQDRKWSEVQQNRPHCVPTDVPEGGSTR